MNTDDIRPSPWDKRIFSMDCFEIMNICEQALSHAAVTPGHYTVKIDPLADKSLLHHYGFYYVDTLIEPTCEQSHFIAHRHPDCSIASNVEIADLLPMCTNSFMHGRFHRDFNLPAEDADRRYAQWLEQLHEEADVFGLYYRQELAGFIACKEGKLLLHTITSSFRGKGLAKFFWSVACERLFQDSVQTITSSISAANLPVLNLYSSLGFRFTHAVDTYHRLSR